MEANSTLQEVYGYVNGKLSLGDRLKLVALILKDLTHPSIEVVDQGDSWTEQDQIDIAAFSLSYADSIYPESEEPV